MSIFHAVLWRTLIKKHGGQVTSALDISSLAKITDGYTPGQMDTACARVLTERRINQLSKKPLTSVEFVTHLARMDPVYKEEEEAFKVCMASSIFCVHSKLIQLDSVSDLVR